MQGGTGDDTYVVGSTGDVVTELADEGIDTVRAAANHTLGANVENLILTGTSGLTGTGNALDNVIDRQQRQQQPVRAAPATTRSTAAPATTR